MKKMNFMMLLLASVSFLSCKTAKYPELGEGLFADIQTSKGDIVVKLHYKETPVTVANFVTLAEGKNKHVTEEYKGKPYYDGTIFHRVISGFMIQGGDPTGTGMGSPGYRFDDEIVESLKHNKKGILSMANAGPATNGSQFFITHVPTPFLDGRHAVFGETVLGDAVIDSIANVKTGANDRPEQAVTIKKIDIIRNGNEATEFDAVKVFDDYVAERNRKEQEMEIKTKAQSEKFLSEIKVQESQAKVLPSGVKIFMLNEGNGEKPNNTQEVLVNYAGYLTNGTLFDSNIKLVNELYGKYDIKREEMEGYKPFPMPYHTSANLIPGFKEGLLTLKVGDKARIFIPSALAYGERGAGDVIPPNSDLIFDIEIVDIVQ
ncbi:peptidylprolyl isomerase [Capnocytophaga canimorsus]|uniref:peptidylprolyl isomerase n=1 Tax=Capnocytophaga canimorsus TaxID=28188 RepID=UPI0038588777